MSLNEEVKAYKSWCDKMGRNPERSDSLDKYLQDRKGSENENSKNQRENV